MKFQYAFILGNHPVISQAEIIALLPHAHILCSTNETLFIELSTDLPSDFLNGLGGTIKIARIESETKMINNQIFELILNKREEKQHTRNHKKREKIQIRKIDFGISWYGSKNRKLALRNGLEFKKYLKSKGIKSRLVTSQGKTLSSVVVEKNHLVSDGIEFIIIENGHDFYSGYTIAIQNFESYSLRDYGRPARDDRSGMLPPKVAQMLINLTGTDKNRILLDPFCGSGTILQEALLLGYEKIIGADKDIVAIENTKKNLVWLSTHFLPSYKQTHSDTQKESHRVKAIMPELIESPIENLNKYIKGASVHCIVFEGFLGSPNITYRQLPGTVAELTALYKSTFHICAQLLVANGIIACALPAWRFHNTFTFLPMNTLLPKNLQLQNRVNQTPRKSFIYARPMQTVCREIFILKKRAYATDGIVSPCNRRKMNAEDSIAIITKKDKTSNSDAAVW
ncbi:MAG: hypothetical protein A3B74_01065 [Candidatus Kerfeldbacteria bacterium RIFCSPHIGHO2_02_FULL_42_14]|uniref:Ribosomal RNA large subunit methyltransferase K/L-like methyltransferase domain-containing protein n=1 Tax=Candidatus Kerfeldbacteria bacterium RIFCSPHIGHO2_02_FULL_42_14 TaxID=1798540 RepID=A0A1G2ARA1_9BACT|nr:MAG: hypothetical protein A3B74_01065 [Candidatus Kerfeldbacteria bacterium RIFCSPHIGHO2_02_FULL_42_14]OGY83424.1 MAG: hypothetical protein A3I91_02110 [Candidatus Kerfeldbacteria bacterium RIFCSPLOWO2_02_FULL_42_19]OGY85566.1 MAG: hypothetical protein A3G01_03710 [Candidatus Kerfeldbacteria bacterium RIFCSPLOWO2_12_FULL_43_9]